ncbi:MAG: phosphoenolpyruvate--protein phosphotransferase [Planctomycetes bacterium]|nr:phosphoenolpyruvate--protein phosphotransferase [Planctomycetota bacterium]
MAEVSLFQGTAIAAGVGIGKVYIALTSEKNVPLRHIDAGECEVVWGLLDLARCETIRQLELIRESTAEIVGASDAAIYSTQIAVLEDPEALSRLRAWVFDDHYAPESAVQAYIDFMRNQFSALDKSGLRDMSADFTDPWVLVLREMSAEDLEHAQDESISSMVLVADELTPTLVVRYPHSKIAGIVASRGGRYSHAAILARSFGIPTVTNIDNFDDVARSGMNCIVNGDAGEVELNPSHKQLVAANQLAVQREQLKEQLSAAACDPCATADGVRVPILANIESPRDFTFFNTSIVSGVGLFRTEFMYMENDGFPTVEQQESVYREVIKEFGSQRVVFRTLDVGNDKQLSYLNLHNETNPALGMRGLRLSLHWPDIFFIQLQALFNASTDGVVDIMLPMVTSVEEIREAKKMFSLIVGDKEHQVRFGVMIEVPAAAMALSDIVKEVDFVSVGTNDLAQYLFAVDRDNPWVTNLYQPYHPANLRVLRSIAKICRKNNTPVSVCGEMAGQPEGAFFLVGCGYDSLSMSPALVPEIKAYLREVDSKPLFKLAMRATHAPTSDEAFHLLNSEAQKVWKKMLDSKSG